MAKQIKTKSVSFRIPIHALRMLKKIPEHTKWIQNLALINLGLCPLCGSHLIKSTNVDEKKEVK